MAIYKDLFSFAAKVGCLEGYLHERSNPDISTMPDWVGNIERMYRDLPAEAKGELTGEYRIILEKIVRSYEALPNRDPEILSRLKKMLTPPSSR